MDWVKLISNALSFLTTLGRALIGLFIFKTGEKIQEGEDDKKIAAAVEREKVAEENAPKTIDQVAKDAQEGHF